MNARDSEKLVGILEKVGYEIIEDENADFVIYNTCRFRSFVLHLSYKKYCLSKYLYLLSVCVFCCNGDQ